MARHTRSKQQKKADGEKLREIFKQAQKKNKSLTQESFANEMNTTQGLLGQWLSGETSIPDKRLLWIAKRLDFDALEFRPSLQDYFDRTQDLESKLTSREAKLLKAWRKADESTKSALETLLT